MVFLDPVLIKSLLDAADKDMSFVLDMCRALISQLGPSSIRTRIINKVAGGQGGNEVSKYYCYDSNSYYSVSIADRWSNIADSGLGLFGQ